MMEVCIAPKARSNIENILIWTEENFGPKTMKRYAKLIAKAIEAVAENLELLGSIERREIAKQGRTYHLFFSRKSAGRAGSRIRQPRHLLLYRERAFQEQLEAGKALR